MDQVKKSRLAVPAEYLLLEGDVEQTRHLSGQTNIRFRLLPDSRRSETVWRSQADRNAAAL